MIDLFNAKEAKKRTDDYNIEEKRKDVIDSIEWQIRNGEYFAEFEHLPEVIQNELKELGYIVYPGDNVIIVDWSEGDDD